MENNLFIWRTFAVALVFLFCTDFLSKFLNVVFAVALAAVITRWASIYHSYGFRICRFPLIVGVVLLFVVAVV